jgi:hypothetical protein
VVGAVHVTCADESERECTQAFDRGFTDLLPDLKFGQQSHFRIANLGARYEWGVVRIAEEHFAIAASESAYKLMVIKLNAHVSVSGKGQGANFGTLDRYGKPSSCCGALAALVAGKSGVPFLDDLREAFTSEGTDRIAILQDESKTDPESRLLLAAVCNALLQAKRALKEIQEYKPETPTLYYVLPCVTLNRAEEDTELLCGVYKVDARTHPPQVEYLGMGDDPLGYRIDWVNGILQVEDTNS